MANKKEKTRYSDVELEEFQEIIESKLKNAKEQFSFYKGQLKEITESDEAKLKSLADGISSTENERISTLAARTKKHIQHLENALLRVQNKVFGICRESGKLISKERLKAVPHATLSIEAKQKR